MNKSRRFKEYRWSTIALIVIIVILVLSTELLIPKTLQRYEQEVKHIASARVYYGYTNCPNGLELDKIKTIYINSIPEKEVNKRVWVLKNFSSVYTDTCIKDK